MRFSRVVVLLAVSCAGASVAAQTPVTSEWIYQGDLTLAGAPVSGSADFQFTLWDAAMGGTPVTTTLLRNNVAVSEGVFTVGLDFGFEVLNGDARWLEIAVRSPSGAGGLATLSPRQPVTATPYALQTRGLFVAANENVGIGTTGPQSPLHVVGADNDGTDAGLRIVSGGQVMLLDGNEIDSNSTIGLHLNNNVPQNVILATGGGNVGIGSDTPGAPLVVRGRTEAQAIRFEGPERNFRFLMDLDALNQASFSFRTATSGASDMVIDTLGRVGIGETTPEQLLHLFGNQPVLKIQGDGTNEETGRISLRQSNNTGFDILYDGVTGVDSLKIERFNSGISSGFPLSIDVVSGEVTITTAVRTPPRMRTIVLTAADALVANPNGRTETGSGRQRVTFGGLSSVLYALDLPDGATITHISAAVEDAATNGSISMRLQAQEFGQAAPVTSASVATGTAAAPGLTMLDLALSETLDRSQFGYFVRFIGTGSPPNGIMNIYEVEVQYTTETIE